jgi:hypothetical protein
MWIIKMKTISAGPDGVKLAGKEYKVTPEEGKKLVPVYAELVSKQEEILVPESKSAEEEIKQNIQKDIQQETVQEVKIDSFVCPDCQKEFKTKNALMSHSRTHKAGD